MEDNTVKIKKFRMGLSYTPGIQKRQSRCACCWGKIKAGEKIVVGLGFFSTGIVSLRYKEEHYRKELERFMREWYLAHPYVIPTDVYSPEERKKLNALRAKRLYLRKKGGEDGNLRNASLEEIDREITEIQKKKQIKNKFGGN
jgi:hypothetical protein